MQFASARAAGELFDRDEEQRAIARAVAAASAGEGRLLTIEGAAGLGKSRLLAFAEAEALSSGLSVLSARGREQEQSFSFGTVLQLFEPWLSTLDPRRRDALFAGAAKLAAPLLDGREHVGSPGTEGDSMYPLLHGLFWLTANIAADGPVIISVDDLHWADTPSVRLLLYLANRLEGLPLMLAVTWRPVEGSPGEDLALHPAGQRLGLQPLSQSGVTKMLQASLEGPASEAFARACMAATKGNPFYLQQVVKAVQDDRIAPDDANAAEVSTLHTDDLKHYLAVRVSRLGPEATALATAVAVLGDGTSVAPAAQLAELDTAVAAKAADALSAEDVFAPGVPLSFAHPLTRRAVYEQIAPAQRSRSHLRAACILAERDADAEAVGAHLLLAPEDEAGWAASALTVAADQARRRGNQQSAAAYLRRALREAMPANERGDVLLSLARLESALGDPAGELHAKEALPLVDVRRQAEVYKVLGDGLYAQGQFGNAARTFEQGLAAVEDQSSPLFRELQAAYVSAASVDIEMAPRAMAHIGGFPGDLPRGETPAERAVLALLSTGLWVSGAPGGQAASAARRAWRGGELLSDEGPDGWAWSLLTAVLTMTDELSLSSEIAETVIDEARRGGSLMAYATASFCGVSPAWRAGRLSEARALAEATVEAVKDGWRTYPCSIYAVYAGLLVSYDELDAAERALGVADEPEHLQSVERSYALDSRGRLRLLQGRNEEALADCTAAGEILERSHWRVSFFEWRSGAALASFRLGDEVRARELAAEGLALAEANQVPSYRAHMLRAKAQISRADESVELLEQALALVEHSEVRLEYLYVLADLGAALRRVGRRAEARERLQPAMDLAHRFGARLVARQVLDELRILGSRPRRLTVVGVDSLTAGERRVAEMAANGMGNREIAQALFVTTRAVEKHLYASYQKLGIRSRLELPAALFQPSNPSH